MWAFFPQKVEPNVPRLYVVWFGGRHRPFCSESLVGSVLSEPVNNIDQTMWKKTSYHKSLTKLFVRNLSHTPFMRQML